jgi:uncharacterized protein YceH (UPF0502 family)
MVKIIDALTKVNAKTHEEYNVVVLMGEVQIMNSKSNGKPYLTAKKVTMPTTLDQAHAKELVGTTLPGVIKKVECPEYEIKMPNSNKKVKITHSFQYSNTATDKAIV